MNTKYILLYCLKNVVKLSIHFGNTKDSTWMVTWRASYCPPAVKKRCLIKLV